MNTFHLKRCGPERTKEEAANYICFQKNITVIGRNPGQVDYVLTSSNYMRNAAISRRHARVVKNSRDCFTLFDDSRNGVFVNDIKIEGNQILNEGDTVTFGHLNGENIAFGTRSRQPDSEYQFLFEQCFCSHRAVPQVIGQSHQVNTDAPQKLKETQFEKTAGSLFSLPPPNDAEKRCGTSIKSHESADSSPNNGMNELQKTVVEMQEPVQNDEDKKDHMKSLHILEVLSQNNESIRSKFANDSKISEGDNVLSRENTTTSNELNIHRTRQVPNEAVMCNRGVGCCEVFQDHAEKSDNTEGALNDPVLINRKHTDVPDNSLNALNNQKVVNTGNIILDNVQEVVVNEGMVENEVLGKLEYKDEMKMVSFDHMMNSKSTDELDKNSCEVSGVHKECDMVDLKKIRPITLSSDCDATDNNLKANSLKQVDQTQLIDPNVDAIEKDSSQDQIQVTGPNIEAIEKDSQHDQTQVTDPNVDAMEKNVPHDQIHGTFHNFNVIEKDLANDQAQATCPGVDTIEKDSPHDQAQVTDPNIDAMEKDAPHDQIQFTGPNVDVIEKGATHDQPQVTGPNIDAMEKDSAPNQTQPTGPNIDAMKTGTTHDQIHVFAPNVDAIQKDSLHDQTQVTDPNVDVMEEDTPCDQIHVTCHNVDVIEKDSGDDQSHFTGPNIDAMEKDSMHDQTQVTDPNIDAMEKDAPHDQIQFTGPNVDVIEKGATHDQPQATGPNVDAMEKDLASNQTQVTGPNIDVTKTGATHDQIHVFAPNVDAIQKDSLHDQTQVTNPNVDAMEEDTACDQIHVTCHNVDVIEKDSGDDQSHFTGPNIDAVERDSLHDQIQITGLKVDVIEKHSVHDQSLVTGPNVDVTHEEHSNDHKEDVSCVNTTLGSVDQFADQLNENSTDVMDESLHKDLETEITRIENTMNTLGDSHEYQETEANDRTMERVPSSSNDRTLTELIHHEVEQYEEMKCNSQLNEDHCTENSVAEDSGISDVLILTKDHNGFNNAEKPLLTSSPAHASSLNRSSGLSGKRKYGIDSIFINEEDIKDALATNVGATVLRLKENVGAVTERPGKKRKEYVEHMTDSDLTKRRCRPAAAALDTEKSYATNSGHSKPGDWVCHQFSDADCSDSDLPFLQKSNGHPAENCSSEAISSLFNKEAVDSKSSFEVGSSVRGDLEENPGDVNIKVNVVVKSDQIDEMVNQYEDCNSEQKVKNVDQNNSAHIYMDSNRKGLDYTKSMYKENCDIELSESKDINNDVNAENISENSDLSISGPICQSVNDIDARISSDDETDEVCSDFTENKCGEGKRFKSSVEVSITEEKHDLDDGEMDISSKEISICTGDDIAMQTYENNEKCYLEERANILRTILRTFLSEVIVTDNATSQLIVPSEKQCKELFNLNISSLDTENRRIYELIANKERKYKENKIRQNLIKFLGGYKETDTEQHFQFDGPVLLSLQIDFNLIEKGNFSNDMSKCVDEPKVQAADRSLNSDDIFSCQDETVESLSSGGNDEVKLNSSIVSQNLCLFLDSSKESSVPEHNPSCEITVNAKAINEDNAETKKDMEMTLEDEDIVMEDTCPSETSVVQQMKAEENNFNSNTEEKIIITDADAEDAQLHNLEVNRYQNVEGVQGERNQQLKIKETTDVKLSIGDKDAGVAKCLEQSCSSTTGYMLGMEELVGGNRNVNEMMDHMEKYEDKENVDSSLQLLENKNVTKEGKPMAESDIHECKNLEPTSTTSACDYVPEIQSDVQMGDREKTAIDDKTEYCNSAEVKDVVVENSSQNIKYVFPENQAPLLKNILGKMTGAEKICCELNEVTETASFQMCDKTGTLKESGLDLHHPVQEGPIGALEENEQHTPPDAVNNEISQSEDEFSLCMELSQIPRSLETAQKNDNVTTKDKDDIENSPVVATVDVVVENSKNIKCVPSENQALLLNIQDKTRETEKSCCELNEATEAASVHTCDKTGTLKESSLDLHHPVQEGSIGALEENEQPSPPDAVNNDISHSEEEFSLCMELSQFPQNLETTQKKDNVSTKDEDDLENSPVVATVDVVVENSSKNIKFVSSKNQALLNIQEKTTEAEKSCCELNAATETASVQMCDKTGPLKESSLDLHHPVQEGSIGALKENEQHSPPNAVNNDISQSEEEFSLCMELSQFPQNLETTQKKDNISTKDKDDLENSLVVATVDQELSLEGDFMYGSCETTLSDGGETVSKEKQDLHLGSESNEILQNENEVTQTDEDSLDIHISSKTGTVSEPENTLLHETDDAQDDEIEERHIVTELESSIDEPIVNYRLMRSASPEFDLEANSEESDGIDETSNSVNSLTSDISVSDIKKLTPNNLDPRYACLQEATSPNIVENVELDSSNDIHSSVVHVAVISVSGDPIASCNNSQEANSVEMAKFSKYSCEDVSPAKFSPQGETSDDVHSKPETDSSRGETSEILYETEDTEDETVTENREHFVPETQDENPVFLQTDKPKADLVAFQAQDLPCLLLSTKINMDKINQDVKTQSRTDTSKDNDMSQEIPICSMDKAEKSSGYGFDLSCNFSSDSEIEFDIPNISINIGSSDLVTKELECMKIPSFSLSQKDGENEGEQKEMFEKELPEIVPDVAFDEVSQEGTSGESFENMLEQIISNTSTEDHPCDQFENEEENETLLADCSSKELHDDDTDNVHQRFNKVENSGNGDTVDFNNFEDHTQSDGCSIPLSASDIDDIDVNEIVNERQALKHTSTRLRGDSYSSSISGVGSLQGSDNEESIKESEESIFDAPVKKEQTTLNEDSVFSTAEIKPSITGKGIKRKYSPLHDSEAVVKAQETKIAVKKEESSDKLGSVLDRIMRKRSKRSSIDESVVASTGDSSAPSSQETPDMIPNNDASSSRFSNVDASDLSRAERHVKRANDVLLQLEHLFLEKADKLGGFPRAEAWKKELVKLKSKRDLPKTVVAVVGDTGCGKSSLINALLDHADILPTSGIRACTAVVVEIVTNLEDPLYRADIDFLSQEEWFDELHLLLNELKGSDGVVKARPPDPQSEAGVAWSKIRAVYGNFHDGVTIDQLVRKRNVTYCLGTTKNITKANARELTQQVNHYIEARETGDGGDYWPIVKHVTLKIPKCRVLSSGTVLVDLPGIRDSNAARDKIAKDFLKSCTAVWVVAGVHRAVDDRTAKELLGSHFRRQLLMDGQYGSVSFVCTKTDQIQSSEIVRGLKLASSVEQIEKSISKMAAERVEIQLEVKQIARQIKHLDQTVEGAKEERIDYERDVKDLEDGLKEYGEDTSDERRQTAEEQLIQLRSVIRESEQQSEVNAHKCKQLRIDKRSKEKSLLELEKKVAEKTREVAVVCAKARNEYTKKEIKRDFKAGLNEMRRQASLDSDESYEEQIEEESESDIGLTVENLKVFCVSATDYLKLRGKLPQDGPPQTFSKAADTEIPGLQRFVHELTKVRKIQGTKRLLRIVAQYVSDVLSYLCDEGTLDKRMRDHTYEVFEKHLSVLQTSNLPTIVEGISRDLEKAFNTSLRVKSDEGARIAAGKAIETAMRWGSKQNRKTPSEGGYHFSTYRAVINRFGAYKSPAVGPVDFNEDLAGPMYTTLTIAWDQVFNTKLQQILTNYRLTIIGTMKKFATKIRQDLLMLGVATERIDRVYIQQLSSVSNKLIDTNNVLMEYITERQREISRTLTPSVQQSMMSAYTACREEVGAGCYSRMKEHMQSHIDEQRSLMFDEASKQLLDQLLLLHAEIINKLNEVVQSLLNDLTNMYEPLWEEPVTTKLLREIFLPKISQHHGALSELLEEAGVELEHKSGDEADLFASQQSKEILRSSLSHKQSGAASQHIGPSLKDGVDSSGRHCKVNRENVLVYERGRSESGFTVKVEKLTSDQPKKSAERGAIGIVNANIGPCSSGNMNKQIGTLDLSRKSSRPSPGRLSTSYKKEKRDCTKKKQMVEKQARETSNIIRQISENVVKKAQMKGLGAGVVNVALSDQTNFSDTSTSSHQMVHPQGVISANKAQHSLHLQEKPQRFLGKYCSEVLQQHTVGVSPNTGSSVVSVKSEPGTSGCSSQKRRKPKTYELVDLTETSDEEEDLPPMKKFMGNK